MGALAASKSSSISSYKHKLLVLPGADELLGCSFFVVPFSLPAGFDVVFSVSWLFTARVFNGLLSHIIFFLWFICKTCSYNYFALKQS